MAKLTILAAVALVALLAMAEASAAFRTTVTTTVVEEEEGNRPEQRCQEQIQRQQQLRHCQSYLRERRRSPNALDMTTDEDQNPRAEEHLEQCCQQLRSLDEQCRCEGIRQAVRQQQQQTREQRGQRTQEMVREAENLPARCNVSPHSCQVGSPRWI